MKLDNTNSSTVSDDDYQAELSRLRTENAQLKELLRNHGIAWKEEATAPPRTATSFAPENAGEQFSASEKIAIFRRLFSGRTDVFPRRWESAKGKSGYSPVCGNEWKQGVCNKPRVKCGSCSERQLLPLTDEVIYDHLAGKHTIGIYPLLSDDHCHFLAVDFDKADWREDALSFMQSCGELSLPSALEISRSGNGAHVWIFFAEAVPAKDARQLGAILISHTCTRIRQLSLTSYDRLFPNQDSMPRGGFGNLIALPLQRQPREMGRSLFVGAEFEPYPDQWAFLASIKPLSRAALEDAIQKDAGGGNPLDVSFVMEEGNTEPWKQPLDHSKQINEPLPEVVEIVLADRIYVPKVDLPQPLSNRLVRLAAFQNPEFYKAQAMRLPVWNKPRIIGCAENFPQHIVLPRGCLDGLLDLFEQNEVRVELRDERWKGDKIDVKFIGILRSDQEKAVKRMSQQDTGVLCAPTAFGKTVVAAALIARRKCTTLILVHRTELLRQWQERLASFLDLPKGVPGALGGGKKKLSGQIDIAVLQSLSKRDDLVGLLDGYGQVIVDECHHLSAFSFETILKQAKARYVLGLTATPIRRDGHHPIIFMQCGPIRHRAEHPESAPTNLQVLPRYLETPGLPTEGGIQEVFRALTENAVRNQCIVQDILQAYAKGRKLLVLTERTAHLERLLEGLENKIGNCFTLHGRMSKKQRRIIHEQLAALDDAEPRVLLATGKLVGEGFDHPPLDTLFLSMPISWKGTLQQYAGRLHREHILKEEVLIYDYVELEHPQLARMWEKRQRGYRTMGYRLR